MTFAQYILKQLDDHAVLESDAKLILEELKQYPACKAMAERWDHKVDRYQVVMLTVLWNTARHVTYEWLKKNAPEAWNLEFFADAVASENEDAPTIPAVTDAEVIGQVASNVAD